MDIQNIIIECVDILSLQPKPITSFLELANIDLIAALFKLMKNEQDVTFSSTMISSEINALLEEHFSSTNLIDVEGAINGNNLELRILYLLLIYIALLTNANLRSKFFSSHMSLSTELKLTYLMECIQENPIVSHQDLEILVQKNLDFVAGSQSSQINIGCSPQLRVPSPAVKIYQSPLKDYLQSPSFKYQKKLDEKNREIKNLRQQIFNLESEKQDLQDENVSLAKKKERKEIERQKVSNELKTLMTEYEESTNSALMDEKEDKKLILNANKKMKLLEAENKNLTLEYSKMLNENTELSKKYETIQNELNVMTTEKDKLAESTRSLQQACISNDALMEDQSSELLEIKQQLEELKRCFQEQKSFSRTIDETYDSRMLQTGNQDMSMSTIVEESMVTGLRDDTRTHLEDLQRELSSKNKIIKDLSNECEQLTIQLTCIERKFAEKKTYCTSLLLTNEDLISELDILKSKITNNIQQNSVPDTFEQVNKQETRKNIMESISPKEQVDNSNDENNCHLKVCQLEEEREKLKEKIERLESFNTERAEKYEKMMEENRNLLEKIIHIKDEKETVQILLSTFKEDKYSLANKHTTLEDKINMLTSQNKRLEDSLENMRENIGKKDDQLQSQLDKIYELKEEKLELEKEVTNCCQKLSAYKNGSVDIQRQALSAKEDAFQVENDLQKSIDILTSQLQSSNEAISSHKKFIQKMKTSYKKEMEKIMEQAGELVNVEKDNAILKQKYESCKMNLLNCRQHLDDVTSSNTFMAAELKRIRLKQMDFEKAQKQSLARFQKLEDQPQKLKLTEVEGKLKRVITERNSLNAQLQMAESSLRNMKKDEMRSSIMRTSSTVLRSQQSRVANMDCHTKSNTANKENMEAPPPPVAKSTIRSHSMALREPKGVLKKTTSVANCTSAYHGNVGLTRRQSVTSRMTDYNFNVRNVIPHALPSVEDEEDGCFVDGNIAAIEDNSLDWRRVSELQRRNSLYPPHMRSDYTAELQYKSVPYGEDHFRAGKVDRFSIASSYNLRKRSAEFSSTQSDRKVRRLTVVCSTSIPKSESWDIPVEESTSTKPTTSLKSPKLLRETRHGLSQVRRTPSSLSRILKGSKSPWKKLHDKKEDEPSSSEASRKRKFRNPFGSKNYNVRSASMKHENQSS